MTPWNAAAWRARTWRERKHKMHGPVGEHQAMLIAVAARAPGCPHELTCGECGYHVCSCERQSLAKCVVCDDAQCKCGSYAERVAKVGGYCIKHTARYGEGGCFSCNVARSVEVQNQRQAQSRELYAFTFGGVVKV